MKKIYIAIAAVLLAAASVATFLSIRSHNRMDDFFRANVDALTEVENDYDKKIWHIYDREDGGFNCTKGGEKVCQ